MRITTLADRLARLTPEQRALFERRVQEKASAAAPLPRRREGERVQLSFAQERLWLLERFTSGTSLHVVGLHFRLEGPLDARALERALREIVRRHEPLRTTFDEVDGVPAPVVRPAPAGVLPITDLAALPAAARDAEAARIASEAARRPFDLRSDLPLRAALLRLGDEAHVLLVTVHHVAFDGWSAGVLLRELSMLYRALLAGSPSPLPELPVAYADFATWQRERFGDDALQAELAHWRAQLAGAPTRLDLPSDRPLPAVPSYRSGRERFELPAELCASIEALARASGVTTFMVLLAGYQLLLQRWSGSDDIVVGTPIHGRRRTEIEGLIGVFINTLALRTDLSGEPSFRELLGRVREVVTSAFAHQDLPFEKLVEALNPDRRTGSSPLFQAMLVLPSGLAPELALDGVTATALPVENGAIDVDLSLSLVAGSRHEGAGPAGLVGAMRYRADLFDAATIQRMIGHYRALLQAAVADPDRPASHLPILPLDEHRRVVEEWNQTEAAFPRDLCVHHLFQAQAARVPESIAVTFADESLTYESLAARAAKLARRLIARGAGPGTRVGVLLERSPEMVVALLAVLESGAAYVPLDPDHAPARLAFMLEDAGASLLITHPHLAARIPTSTASVVLPDSATDDDALPLDSPSPRAPEAGDLAYVIYTSGSTGRPKGVAITHRAVVNFLTTMAAEPGLTERDTLLAVTTVSFDIAGLEIFLPLSVGARIVLADRPTASDGRALRALLESSGATVLQATPATWRLLVDAGFHGGPGFTALSGGDVLPPDLAGELLGRVGALYNLYGPTETTIWSTLHRVTDALGAIPIGRPIANTRVHVLDRHLAPVPVGVAGELCIGGDGLSPGYLGRPELTADRFVPDPFVPGALLYRTGDRARYRADGALEHLGRVDFQIKLRGYRIEPGEIEAALAAHPAIHEAAVVARLADAPGPADLRLVAFLVTSGERPSPAELRAHLAASLPEYMIPSAFVFLDQLPLTPNAKVDRAALIALPLEPTEHREKAPLFAAPADRLEAELVAIWESVLGVRPISTHDDFFELGGHSMLAARLFDRIEQHTRRRLPLATLLEAPTVERLATILRREGCASAWPSLVALQAGGSRPPFFCVHAVGGNVLSYRLLARGLGPDQPFYGLQARGLDGIAAPHGSVEEMAADYLDEIRSVQPSGPYRLGGASAGGIIAYEMARQLRERGEDVALLVLIDTYPIRSGPPRQRSTEKLDWYSGHLLLRAQAAWPGYLVETARGRLRGQLDRLRRTLPGAFSRAPKSARESFLLKSYEMMRRYVPKRYPGTITKLISLDEPHRAFDDPRLRWGALADEGLVIRLIPGSHDTMLDEANVAGVAAELDACLRRSTG